MRRAPMKNYGTYLLVTAMKLGKLATNQKTFRIVWVCFAFPLSSFCLARKLNALFLGESWLDNPRERSNRDMCHVPNHRKWLHLPTGFHDRLMTAGIPSVGSFQRRKLLQEQFCDMRFSALMLCLNNGLQWFSKLGLLMTQSGDGRMGCTVTRVEWKGGEEWCVSTSPGNPFRQQCWKQLLSRSTGDSRLQDCKRLGWSNVFLYSACADLKRKLHSDCLCWRWAWMSKHTTGWR